MPDAIADSSVTPLMKQYFDLRKRYAGAILFFRLGDFYEMFADDAQYVSRVLGLTLTQRGGYPMCGIPYHASPNYIDKLLALGNKVAICEQITAPAKGLAVRDVVEVLTPASVLDGSTLTSSQNNFLAGLGYQDKLYSFSYIDLSTGEFCAMSKAEAWSYWLSEWLDKLAVREILVQESLIEPALTQLCTEKNIVISQYPHWFFESHHAYQQLVQQLGVTNLKAFGFDEGDIALSSAGAILHYLEENTKHNLPHVLQLHPILDHYTLKLDEVARRNLELFKQQDGSTQFTLYQLMNENVTPMGQRLLKKWLIEPLSDRPLIDQRLQDVDWFYNHPDVLATVRTMMAKIQDIARITSRIGMDKAHPKDFIALKKSLMATLQCHQLVPNMITLPSADMSTLSVIVKRIENILVEEPAVDFSHGNIIKSGFHPELDQCRYLAEHGLQALQDYTAQERELTKINLRLKENRILGYYFEMNKSQADQLPPRFLRRQSMLSGERVVTDQLIQLQQEIHEAKDKSTELEKQLFLTLRNDMKEDIPIFLALSDRLAYVDNVANFAYLALKYSYCRPSLHDTPGIHIVQGRHPVVEQHIPSGEFVSNDLVLTSEKNTHLITGPNMAGKSTYLRQTALIVLMAHIGSYVPAAQASIGLVDHIFCRVGAGDNLAKGESTFLLEMSETSHILRHATHRSLVIMDEVGRGTGSDDGLAIARAVLEHLTDQPKSFVLFATHYHELTRIKNTRIINHSLSVLEENNQIYFLKKVKQGPASGSYGIHVARLAGIPGSVADAAEIYLEQLQQQRGKLHKALVQQQALDFGALPDQKLLQLLQQCDMNSLTPLEALNLLHQWQKMFVKKV
jgi:DNA mismatch repair protein MutS